MEHYTLTEYQLSNLDRMANGENQLLVVVGPAEGDAPDTAKNLNEHLQAALDLVGLGLLEDKTAVAIETVTGMKLKTGRDMKAYLITQVGKDMFRSTTYFTEKVN